MTKTMNPWVGGLEHTDRDKADTHGEWTPTRGGDKCPVTVTRKGNVKCRDGNYSLYEEMSGIEKGGRVSWRKPCREMRFLGHGKRGHWTQGVG